MTQIPKVILVTGMHRSGTSCLTQVLSNSGYSLGHQDSLMLADQFNEHGYFENTDVVSQNDDLLHQLISSVVSKYNLPVTNAGAIQHAWHLSAYLPSLQLKEHQYPVAVPQGLSTGDTTIVLKDPRFCLTLPAWQKHLDIKAVIVLLRHPSAVIQSLKLRDQHTEPYARLLWYGYYLNLARNLTDIPYHLVFYDELLTNPRTELQRLAQFGASSGSMEILEFQYMDVIDTSLNHAPEADPTNIFNSYDMLFQKRAFDELIINDIELNYYHALHEVALLDRLLLQHYECFSEQLSQSLSRLNRHPIVGNMIKLLRLLKDDNTFGQ